MSNYSPILAYGPKDALAHGDPNKAIKGAQLDSELAAIASAISTKLDSSAGGGSQVSFSVTASGAYNGSVTLSYYKFGPVVFVWSNATYASSGGNPSTTGLLVLSTFPAAIRPALNISGALAAVLISGISTGNPTLGYFSMTSGGVVTMYPLGGAFAGTTGNGLNIGTILSYVAQ